MAEGRPSNVRAINDRLRNHCKEVGRNYSRARQHLGALVVAQMLAEAQAVIKGGRNLEIRYGIAATRASSDLDTVRVQSLEDFLDTLEDAVAEGWQGFGGWVEDKGVIGAPLPAAYRPHRFDVKLTYHDIPFSTVRLEVAVEEAGGLSGVEEVSSGDGEAIFTAVGLPAPDPVPVLALHHQLAQKLHACTAPDTDGWTNDRAHDLVDLQLIRFDLADERLSEVREACERLFRSRQGHEWPPTVTPRDGWEDRYARELEGVEADVHDDLDSAVQWSNELIRAIAAA